MCPSRSRPRRSRSSFARSICCVEVVGGDRVDVVVEVHREHTRPLGARRHAPPTTTAAARNTSRMALFTGVRIVFGRGSATLSAKRISGTVRTPPRMRRIFLLLVVLAFAAPAQRSGRRHDDRARRSARRPLDAGGRGPAALQHARPPLAGLRQGRLPRRARSPGAGARGRRPTPTPAPMRLGRAEPSRLARRQPRLDGRRAGGRSSAASAASRAYAPTTSGRSRARADPHDAIAGSPSIVARSSWEADEKITRAAPHYAPTLKLAVVHHTAGSELVHAGAGGRDRARDRGLPREGERLERHRLQLSRRPLRHRLRGPGGRDRRAT